MTNYSLTIRKIFASIALVVFLLPNCVLATSHEAPPPANPGGGSTSPGGAPSSSSKDGTVTEAELFYNFNYKNANTDTTKIGAVNRIVSNKTWQQVLSDVIKMLLNISGALALIALTVGGVFMVTARGKSDSFDKGKKIVGYAIAGLVVIAVSYAIVVGVSELQFFTPGTGGTSTGSTTGTTTSTNAPAGGGAAQGGSGVTPPQS